MVFLLTAALTFLACSIRQRRERAAVDYLAASTPLVTSAEPLLVEIPAPRASASQSATEDSSQSVPVIDDQNAATQTTLKQNDEELRRTRVKNRRLEALVQVLRQRRLKNDESGKDLDVRFVSGVKR